MTCLSWRFLPHLTMFRDPSPTYVCLASSGPPPTLPAMTVAPTLGALLLVLALCPNVSGLVPLECPIAVRAVHGKGLGAFAAVAVPAGARLCSYHGECLTQRGVAQRYGAGAASQADYLFELRRPSSDAEGLYVDAAQGSHPSRFINHAEDGNLIPSPAGQSDERIVVFFRMPSPQRTALAF